MEETLGLPNNYRIPKDPATGKALWEAPKLLQVGLEVLLYKGTHLTIQMRLDQVQCLGECCLSQEQEPGPES